MAIWSVCCSFWIWYNLKSAYGPYFDILVPLMSSVIQCLNCIHKLFALMCSFTGKWPYNWTHYHSSYSSYYCWIFGLWMWEACSCHTYRYEFLCWCSSWGNVKSLRLNLHWGCAIYCDLWKNRGQCKDVWSCPSTSFCGSNT